MLDTGLNKVFFRVPRILKNLVIFAAVITCLFIADIQAHDQPTDQACTSRFATRQLGPKLVSAILADHRAWFVEALENVASFDAKNPRRANLCRANLTHTNLYRTNFVAVTLRHTVLHGASLHQTNLYKANMADAELDEADLRGVIFEPKAHSLPNVTGLITAKNLATMSFATFPHALEALRGVLHQAGMLEQERQVSLAIQQTIQAKIKKTPWRKRMFKGFLPQEDSTDN